MTIQHNRPWITDADRAAVDAVLASGWVAGGPRVAELEEWFESRAAGGRSCAVSSGTAGLFMALQQLGAHSDVGVVVPTYACSALLNAIYMTGARPVVVDVDAESFNLDPGAIDDSAAELAIAVHTFGAEARVRELMDMGLTVIEDCCQSLGGAGADGRPLGLVGAAAVYSFYATKIVTGGHGGLIWTANGELGERLHDFRAFDCRDEYHPRFNFHLTDIQAAMVVSQLSRIDEIRARRQSIAKAYQRSLPSGWRMQTGITNAGRMVYRSILIAPDRAARDALRAHLEEHHVGNIVPVERHELLHRYLGLDPDRFPRAERLADTTLSLPIYPAMTGAETDHVCEVLARF